MIANPQAGQRVQLWNATGKRDGAPHHGKIGVVEIVGTGKPRNHGVRVDGALVVVPCGNLREPKP